MSDRSVKNVQRLALKHVARYSLQLQRALNGDRTVNVVETARLLDIWQQVQFVGGVYERCPIEARVEIDDAIEAEE